MPFSVRRGMKAERIGGLQHRLRFHFKHLNTMKRSIKRKLSLGVGFQFLLIVVSVTVGMVYINMLRSDTSNILSDNFKSLQYCNAMEAAMDNHESPERAVAEFRENLEKQKANITEAGERQLTEALGRDFMDFSTNPSDSLTQLHIHQNLHALEQMNLEAISRKSAVALDTGKSANIVIGTVGTVSFVFALILLFNLPHVIADPIKAFVAGTQEIARKNYAWRMDEGRNDEFGELARSFNSMAAKLETYESSNMSQMLFEKRRLDILINRMNNPIIGLNQLGTILFVNTAALNILGVRQEELIGRSRDEVMDGNPVLQAIFDARLQEKGIGRNTPLKISHQGREAFFEREVVQVTVPPTGHAREKYIGDVVILQDVTPYKELDTAKTNFIATVSHEFKTPISAMKMSLQLLQNERIGALNPEQRALAASIQEDADRLLGITGELLNLSQVESGQIHLTIQPTALEDIMDYALNATRVQAEQKQVQVVQSFPVGMPLVLADSEKTAWVLVNLISNAIRYSAEGATVHVEGRMLDGFMRVEVRDDGPGIAPEYQAKVFERYFRVPGTQEAGSGLGLAISKEFIEAQGGRIGLESDLGKGSVFWVEMDLIHP
jgi:two-component system, NtrC family, sensor histidine kinase KinB